MKNFILTLGFLVSFSSTAAVSIVSDFDDTIKITNAGDTIELAVNGIFTLSTYSGMPQFLLEADTYADKLHIVTGSPTVIRPRVRALLNKYKIRSDSLHLRNPVREKTPVFKLRVIKKILEESSDDFILIGDDVDEDHHIYDELKTLYPNRILAIYIHAVKNREVPASVVRYYTSFDLTLREVLAGRMNPDQVLRALNILIEEQKPQRIFPGFAECPSEATTWEWQTQTIFSEEARTPSEKLLNFCTFRDQATGKS